MSTAMKIVGIFVLLMNSLCLIRLGLLPSIYFLRSYALYKKNFWLSLTFTVIFCLSEWILIWILFLYPQTT